MMGTALVDDTGGLKMKQKIDWRVVSPPGLAGLYQHQTFGIGTSKSLSITQYHTACLRLQHPAAYSAAKTRSFLS